MLAWVMRQQPTFPRLSEEPSGLVRLVRSRSTRNNIGWTRPKPFKPLKPPLSSAFHCQPCILPRHSFHRSVRSFLPTSGIHPAAEHNQPAARANAARLCLELSCNDVTNLNSKPPLPPTQLSSSLHEPSNFAQSLLSIVTSLLFDPLTLPCLAVTIPECVCPPQLPQLQSSTMRAAPADRFRRQPSSHQRAACTRSNMP